MSEDDDFLFSIFLAYFLSFKCVADYNGAINMLITVLINLFKISPMSTMPNSSKHRPSTNRDTEQSESAPSVRYAIKQAVQPTLRARKADDHAQNHHLPGQAQRKNTQAATQLRLAKN